MVVSMPTSKLRRVAEIQFLLSKYLAYHCREKPSGGNFRNRLALNDMGMMTKMGITRKKNISVQMR
jgi:hypothetical protein